MSQLTGGITVDEGYREVAAGGALSRPGDREYRSFNPDEHESESLGVDVYGAENWILPGFGDSHDECGEYRVEGVCSSCGEPSFAPHQCGRRSCPNCGTYWARQTAMKRSERIQAARHQLDFQQGAHAIVSLEREIKTVQQFIDGKSRAWEIAEEKGFRGGDVIGHAWRLTAEAKELCRLAEVIGEKDVGDWVYLRNEHSERMNFGHPETFLEWSPHYHIVGLTAPDMDPAYESDPYVYKFQRSLTRYAMDSKRSHRDVYGLYRYLLSHATIHRERDYQAVVGYGILSNRTFADFKPSKLTMRRIRQLIEEVAQERLDDDSLDRAGTGDDELGECDLCGGSVISVFAIRDYLEEFDPPLEVTQAMRVAREWRLGGRSPPVGMRAPSTQEEAHEAFETMVEDRIEKRRSV